MFIDKSEENVLFSIFPPPPFIVVSEPMCDKCKENVSSDQFYFINCDENHAICLPCYEKCVKLQVSTDISCCYYEITQYVYR